jgi:glycosyltransferase involved in cell wall biosynthesis
MQSNEAMTFAFGQRPAPRGARQSLLYVSPVVPSLHGNGLAMRSAQVLLALATRYRVTLLVFANYGSPAGQTVPDEVKQACAEWVVVPPGQSPGDKIQPGAFDIVHVFRLGTGPFAEPWLQPRLGAPETWLDLDDIESIAHRRVAALHRALGDGQQAAVEEMLAARAESLEVDALLRFDRVFLAAPDDLERLPICGAARVVTLPNVLPLPASILPPPNDDRFRFLFVGTLGYFPNVEGVLWFGREVLPLVLRRAGRPVETVVVGAGWSPLLPRLEHLAGGHIAGNAADVRPYYEQANAVIVPLRAGGGTRIKVIEAFGLGRPVVGTPIGLEGIDAADGEHALIAGDPEAFAASCLRLIQDPSLGDHLTSNAHELARRRYTPEVLAQLVASWP